MRREDQKKPVERMADEEEEIEEEEEYLAMGKDGRPYIAVRKRLGMKQEDQKKPPQR